MNKYYLSGFIVIPWLVAIAIVAFGGSVAYVKRDDIRQSVPFMATPTPTATPTPKIIANLSDALKEPSALSCKGTPDSQLAQSSIYVDPQTASLRIDAQHNGALVHAIIKGTTYWTWNEGETRGEIMDMSSMQSNPLEIVNQLSCTPWNLDISMFNPPDTVSFTTVQNPIDRAWEAKRKLDALIEETNRRMQQ